MMSSIEARLRADGYKLTMPRRVVARVLEEKRAHMTANEIWERAKSVDESIGRMSVYRTLGLFTQMGYIRPASQSANDARTGLVYVIMHEGHHHHIVCQVCDRVIEITDCGLEDMIQHLQDTYGCKIEGHLVEFFGVCKNCLLQESTP